MQITKTASIREATQAVIKNIISESGASVIGALGLLLVQILLVRYLPDSDFAAFILAGAIIGVSEVFGDFGGRIAGTRAFSIKKDVNNQFSIITLLRLVNGIFLVGVLALWPQDRLSWVHLLVILGISLTQVSNDPFIWFFRGRERMDISAALIVVWRIATTGLLIMAAYFGVPLLGLLEIWLVNNLLRVLLAWGIMRRKFEPAFRIGLTFETVKDSLLTARAVFPIGIALLSLALYNRLGVLLLSGIGSAHDIAVYGISFSLVASTAFIATSICNASFPRVVRAIHTENWGDAVYHIRWNIKTLILIFAPLCILGILLAPFVIDILYPRKLSSASNIIILLLPGLFLSNINLALKFFMNAAEKNWAELLTVVLGIGAFSLSFFLYIPLPLPEITALAWGGSEIVIFAGKVFFITRDKRFHGLPFLLPIVVYLSLLFMAIFQLYT